MWNCKRHREFEEKYQKKAESQLLDQVSDTLVFVKTQIREYTKLGEGVDRVYRDMEEDSLPEPVYRQSEFMLYATLKNKN